LIIEAIILGIIEGLTEFLPVSSTGHLIIANKFMGYEDNFANLFSIIIQSGAIFAVLLFFKDKIFPKSLKKEDLKPIFSLWSRIVIGIIPAGVLGILYDDKIEQLLFNPTTVAIALIIGAFVIIFVESIKLKEIHHEEKELSYLKFLIIGFFQTIAMIPGVSRSAATIIGARLLGVDRKTSAEISFFLAIPTLLGAGLIKMIELYKYITVDQVVTILVGLLASFISAYLVIAFFMNYIKKHDFKLFAYYRILLGILVLLIL
jgi:undecaprenyl-diphosphatase